MRSLYCCDMGGVVQMSRIGRVFDLTSGWARGISMSHEALFYRDCQVRARIHFQFWPWASSEWKTRPSEGGHHNGRAQERRRGERGEVPLAGGSAAGGAAGYRPGARAARRHANRRRPRPNGNPDHHGMLMGEHRVWPSPHLLPGDRDVLDSALPHQPFPALRRGHAMPHSEARPHSEALYRSVLRHDPSADMRGGGTAGQLQRDGVRNTAAATTAAAAAHARPHARPHARRVWWAPPRKGVNDGLPCRCPFVPDCWTPLHLEGRSRPRLGLPPGQQPGAPVPDCWTSLHLEGRSRPRLGLPPGRQPAPRVPDRPGARLEDRARPRLRLCHAGNPRPQAAMPSRAVHSASEELVCGRFRLWPAVLDAGEDRRIRRQP